MFHKIHIFFIYQILIFNKLLIYLMNSSDIFLKISFKILHRNSYNNVMVIVRQGFAGNFQETVVKY